MVWDMGVIGAIAFIMALFTKDMGIFAYKH